MTEFDDIIEINLSCITCKTWITKAFVPQTTSALCWLKAKFKISRKKPKTCVLSSSTHHCLLDVNFLTTRQTKVCYLCHKAVTDKDIPGCQIPVDELVPRETRRGEANQDFSVHQAHCNAATGKLNTLIYSIYLFCLFLSNQLHYQH